MFFKKNNNIDKPTARLAKKIRKTQILNEKEDTITNLIEIKRTISKYYKQFYGNKLFNLDEMDKFLERHRLPKYLKKK